MSGSKNRLVQNIRIIWLFRVTYPANVIVRLATILPAIAFTVFMLATLISTFSAWTGIVSILA